MSLRDTLKHLLIRREVCSGTAVPAEKIERLLSAADRYEEASARLATVVHEVRLAAARRDEKFQTFLREVL